MGILPMICRRGAAGCARCKQQVGPPSRGGPVFFLDRGPRSARAACSMSRTTGGRCATWRGRIILSGRCLLRPTRSWAGQAPPLRPTNRQTAGSHTAESGCATP